MSCVARIRVAAFLVLTVTSSAAASVLINVPANDVDDNTTQNEPSIAVAPAGSTIVIAWNNITEPLTAGVSWVSYASSINGGATWSPPAALPTVVGGRDGGDPVLAVDRSGTFYITTLAQDNHGYNFIGVARSSVGAGGVTFGTPVLIDKSVKTAVPDKPWIDVDSTGTKYDGRVYVCWKDRATGTLRFTRSTNKPNNPLTFASSVAVSTGTTPQGCSVAVGPAGDVYVTWVDGWGTASETLRIRKSTNGGYSFGSPTNVATAILSGHNTQCNGLNRQVLNGNIRVADNAMMAVDRSSGPYGGSVYVAFSSRPGAGSFDQSDVLITRSPANLNAPVQGDPGVTWSTPVSVHKGATTNPDLGSNDNWFPAIAVSSTTGTVMVTFYDRRNDSANMMIDLYAARSQDGGATWTNTRITGASFGVPPLVPQFNPLSYDCYMGDYNGVAAASNAFHLTWGDNSNMVNGRPDPDVVYEH